MGIQEFTSRIQQRIDRCHESGGGTVTVSPGRHVCGSLQLKSGVTLFLEKGAELVGSPDLTDYPVLAPTVNESTDIRALVYADKAEEIGLAGEGILNGGAGRPLSGKEISKEPTRPELVFLRDCRDVIIRDVMLKDASFWTLHLMHCEGVNVERVTIRNRKDRINTDGIDPDGCKRVRIINCDILTGDDCIVLKSTMGGDCEDVIVTNCLLATHCAALKLGTESIGNIRNVIFSNCIIKGSRMALGLFMKDGGIFENIQATNLIIEDQTEFPIFIDSTPRFHGESKDGYIRNVSLSNITLRSPGRIFVNGSPDHPVENLRLHGFQWTLTGHLQLGSMGKPPGSVRHSGDPDRIPHEFAKAQFTLANIQGLAISDFQLNEERLAGDPDRSLLYQHDVIGERIECGLGGSLEWLNP